MKKIVALLMTIMMVMTAVNALAQTEQIGQSRLSLNLDGMMLYDMDDWELDEDAVLMFGNDDESMFCVVYEYANDGYTLQDLAAAFLQEETSVSASGYTTINGIECFCLIVTEDGQQYLTYVTILDNEIIEFEFSYDDNTAELTGKVMNTLAIR